MTTKQDTIQAAIREVASNINSDGTYTEYSMYWYFGGRLEKYRDRVVERCGLRASGDSYTRTASTKSLRKLLSLCDRYDVACEAIQSVIDSREDRRCYETTFVDRHGYRLTIRGDFAQASSPISARWNDGEWFGTPFQVADAQHSEYAACLLVARWGG